MSIEALLKKRCQFSYREKKQPYLPVVGLGMGRGSQSRSYRYLQSRDVWRQVFHGH